MTRATLLIPSVIAFLAAPAVAGDWSPAAEVRHDLELCVSYRARLDGEYLVVEAAPQKGWHTFAMDNKVRAEEKLAGQPSLGIDAPTEIRLSEALELVGPWRQTPPKDFSKPELRWFSWGYEEPALFVAKVRRRAQGPAGIAISGQACTETTCKNIDVSLTVPLAEAGKGPSNVDLSALIPVRQPD